MLVEIIIFTIVFCIFVEIYVGSILIRLDSNNQYTLNLLSMGNFLVHPLYNSFLWNPELIIVNYPFIILLYCLYIWLNQRIRHEEKLIDLN